MNEPNRRSIGAQRNPESHKAILDAARQLLAEKGLAGFSIEAVARIACAGKPTIYRWWPNKASLLLDVYGNIKERLADPDSDSLEGDVAGFLKLLLTFWSNTDAGAIFRAVLAESQTDPEARVALVTYHERRKAHTASLFARPHGDVPPPSPEQAARLAEAAAALCLVRLLMDNLKIDEAELQGIARQLVAGVR
jgi:AcrR family transcriptional regulator